MEDEDRLALVENGEPNSVEIDYSLKEAALSSSSNSNASNAASVYVILSISIFLFIASLATLLCDMYIQSSFHYEHDNVVYGHVHIAKTAGSTINGELAMHYERVCGNKGYSYDAYETNERYKRHGHGNIKYSGDSYSILYPNHNRGKIPPAIMDEMVIKIAMPSWWNGTGIFGTINSKTRTFLFN